MTPLDAINGHVDQLNLALDAMMGNDGRPLPGTFLERTVMGPVPEAEFERWASELLGLNPLQARVVTRRFERSCPASGSRAARLAHLE